MHRRYKLHLTTIILLVAASALAVGASGSVGSVQAKQAKPAQQLNGTWLTTVALQNPPPGVDATFRALDTFVPNGGLLVSSSQGMPVLRSLAQGEWIRTGNRRFASTFVWFRFSPTGTFAGMQRVQRTMTVNSTYTSFQATDTIDLLAPDGTTVLATSHGTESGTRLTAR